MQHHSHKHPIGLWIAATAAGVTSVGFGLLNSLLVLYVRKVFHFDHNTAYTLFAAYDSLLYSLPIVGGYVAGKFGYKRGLVWGNILYVIGLLLMMIHDVNMMYLALGIFTAGVALFAPSYLVLQGKVYAKDDHRRDSGFTISYVIMNVGFLVAAILGGYLTQLVSFRAAFFIAAIIVVSPLAVYYWMLRLIVAHGEREIEAQVEWGRTGCWAGFIGYTIVIVPVCMWLLRHASLNNKLLLGVLVVVCIGLIWLAFSQRSKVAKWRLIVFMLLSLISIGFWALYMLEPSLLTIFIENSVNRHMFGSIIPPSVFYGLDPFFIILMGSLLSMMWIRLAKRNRDPSLQAKFTLSLFSMALGFGLVAVAVWATGYGHYVNMLWVIVAYFFMTMGELLISPIGQAMVGRLSPEGYEGLLMGTWQMFSGVSAAISGFMAAGWAVVPDKATLQQSGPIYFSAFGKIALTTLVLALVSVVLMPFIKRAMAVREHHHLVK